MREQESRLDIRTERTFKLSRASAPLGYLWLTNIHCDDEDVLKSIRDKYGGDVMTGDAYDIDSRPLSSHIAVYVKDGYVHEVLEALRQGRT